MSQRSHRVDRTSPRLLYHHHAGWHSDTRGLRRVTRIMACAGRLALLCASYLLHAPCPWRARARRRRAPRATCGAPSRNGSEEARYGAAGRRSISDLCVHGLCMESRCSVVQVSHGPSKCAVPVGFPTFLNRRQWTPPLWWQGSISCCAQARRRMQRCWKNAARCSKRRAAAAAEAAGTVRTRTTTFARSTATLSSRPCAAHRHSAVQPRRRCAARAPPDGPSNHRHPLLPTVLLPTATRMIRSASCRCSLRARVTRCTTHT